MSRSTPAPDAVTEAEVTQVEVRELPLPGGLVGERLDVALARLLGLSRTAAADLVTGGGVLLDGRPAARSDRVAEGAWVTVTMARPQPAAFGGQAGSAAQLGILLEDDDIVVVDKPVGVAAHPSPGWDGPTVTGSLAAMGIRLSTSGAAERQGVVHRLDVGTTGAMVLAKSELAYSVLKQAFRDRTVDKRYAALVQGHPDPASGTVDAPIDRHPRHDYRWAVVAGGRPSVTHYDTVEAFPAASLLDVRLETGRTHQIRVHMSALRHPCVGDLTYGADPTLAERLGLTRQWLHAATLGFSHPVDGRPVTVTSPPPADLAGALDRLRTDSG